MSSFLVEGAETGQICCRQESSRTTLLLPSLQVSSSPNSCCLTGCLQDAFPLVQESRVLIQTDVHKLTGPTDQPAEQSIKQGNSFPDPAERRGTATSQRRRGRIATPELRSYISRSAPTEQKKVPLDRAVIHEAAERARARGNAVRPT